MKYGSVCSGIEAASVAWEPLGWKAQFFSEIEPFPSAVLAHHWPEVPNLGDMTKHKEWPDATLDVLVGGTPCQSFSVAGLRKGMADPRGNLALIYLAIADQYRPRWLVWENVPGVLSSNGGRDFGAFLGGMGKLGYGFAYRVLDAQFFGVAQRRRRVFVVGCLGDWRGAAAVLFERDSLSGHPAPRRGKGQDAASDAGRRITGADCYNGVLTGDVAATMGARGSSINSPGPTAISCQPIAFGWQNSAAQGDSVSEQVTPTLDKSKTPAIALQGRVRANREVAQTITQNYGKQPDNSDTALGPNLAIHNLTVRRLTPVECERLQGFPDDHTAVPYRNKPAADGPRYKAIGNSMAVPVMRWIGERIDAVSAIAKEDAA